MTDHTAISKVSRLEVIQTGARRRWSAEEKRRIVAESESGPRQVSATARRYGLLPGQLFNWRRLWREGRLERTADTVTFAQAVIACDRAASSVPFAVAAVTSRMEIVLADGIRVVVDKDVDADALARVIGAIWRR
jgi:transposase